MQSNQSYSDLLSEHQLL